MRRRPPASTRTSTLFPSPTLFRSGIDDIESPQRNVAIDRKRRLQAERAHAAYRVAGELHNFIRAQHSRPSTQRLLGLPVVESRIAPRDDEHRSEEHTSELQSLMRSSYAVFCLKKKTKDNTTI